MARSVDEIIRDTVGNLSLQVCQLIATVEQLQEKVKELEAAQKKEAE